MCSSMRKIHKGKIPCSQKGSVLKTGLIIYMVFSQALFQEILKQIEDSLLNKTIPQTGNI